MKDRVFEAKDVPRALEAASLGLGLPVAELRYVVLEEGTEATAAAQAQPARIVVLLDATERAAPAARPLPAARPAPAAYGEVKGRLRRLVAAVAVAAAQELEVAFEDGDETLVVRVSGAGEGLLLEHGGEALRGLEHLLQRAVSRDEPRRIQLTSERFRSERDAFLRNTARELAEAVRGDGVPRETGPLNSYDRRIVHIAVEDERGVRSFSVGEGSARRVTLAPRVDGPAQNPEVQ